MAGSEGPHRVRHPGARPSAPTWSAWSPQGLPSALRKRRPFRALAIDPTSGSEDFLWIPVHPANGSRVLDVARASVGEQTARGLGSVPPLGAGLAGGTGPRMTGVRNFIHTKCSPPVLSTHDRNGQREKHMQGCVLNLFTLGRCQICFSWRLSLCF